MDDKIKNNFSGESKISLNEVGKLLREYEIVRVKNEFVERTTTLVIVSLGLITAMAWEDTIKDIFGRLFHGINTLPEKIIYSFSITLIAVVVSVILSKLMKKSNSKST